MGNYLLKNNPVHVLESKSEYCTYDYGTRQPDYSTHKGIDLINAAGGACDVIAAADGTVVACQNFVKGYSNAYSAGNYVRLYHPDTKTYTRYLHMKPGSVTVKVGDKVNAGDKLGTMGNTGYSFGVHLHFDVFDGKNYVDPLPYLMGEKSLIKKPPDTAAEPTQHKIKVGDTVKVKLGAKFTNGVTPFDFVFNTDFTVMKISQTGKSALVGIDGQYTGWFDTDYLTVISSADSTEPPEKTVIVVGDKVKVKQGATTYFGDKLASFVYQNVYDVIQVGTRNEPGYIVIGTGGQVTAAVNVEDLEKI